MEFNQNHDMDEYLDEQDQDGKFLTFNIAGQEYGIEIKHVTEIIGVQKITELPDIPDFVKGVINLRGKVIPVVDVRLRFLMQERAFDDRTCIVVIDINQNSVGLIVDTVSEVISISGESIDPPPKVNKKIEGNRFVKGLGKVGNDVKIILDTQKLLYDSELEQINSAAEIEL